MKLMSKKSDPTVSELAENIRVLAKHKLGIEKPQKKNKTAKNLAIVGIAAGAIAGIAGILSSKKARDKVSKGFQDTTKFTSDVAHKTKEFAGKELDRLNDLTKEQIEKVKNTNAKSN